ncbi:MAG: proline dehydrogenase family protein [Chitinophagaceae bacterium]|nr:proline dehydrogenase family protein [Chitinophagaceae bacterium]
MKISFENTEYAFAYKSNKELKKARFLFSAMAIGWLVNIGTRITPWAIKARLPINGLLRNTIFKQFVGGETLQQTAIAANKLQQYNVQVILDYGVEGKEGEDNFDHAADEFIKVIRYAASQTNIPFMSVKLTGFARFSLLEKLDAAAGDGDGYEGRINLQILNAAEIAEWNRVVARLDNICKEADKNNIGVLIDAEETWIQDPVDALTMQMMERYNKSKMVVYNTIQLYRHDRLQFLKDSLAQAAEKKFLYGAKLVRGAYMVKERKRAIEKKYPSPIQPSKESADTHYNEAIEFCITHLDKLFLIVASHNDYSNLYTTRLLQQNNLPLNHPHVHFSQLYGMSDNITFNLAKAGCHVSKYLPFGPLKDVIPYLMRRAQENSSVSGQTGKELSLIKTELKRRKFSNT